MIGIELSRPCGDLVKEALKQGLLINVTSDKVVRLLPPLIMKRSEAQQVVDLLSGIIREFLGKR
jgi:acetylornithine aminotransferase